MDEDKLNTYAEKLSKLIEKELHRLGFKNVTVTWNPQTKRHDLSGPGAETVKANLVRYRW